MDRLATIRCSRSGMDIELDPEAEMKDILNSLAIKFRDSARFFKDARMALSFSGRNLNKNEENDILDVITRNTKIQILCVIEQDKKKEEKYRSIIDRTLRNVKKRNGQFYRGTLTRGQILESDSSIVILGNVDAGASVAARDNILIFGTLYGSAYAGVPHDRNAYIAALAMHPKELYIGDLEAGCQQIFQESVSIRGPKIAVTDGKRIYLNPLSEFASEPK